MHTKRVPVSSDPLARLNEALRRPHTWQITGIEAFWLEDAAGKRLTGDFPETGPAYDAVLIEVRAGRSPNDILLVGRMSPSRRSVLGSGLDLLDVAEAHAGIPAGRRIPRAGKEDV